MPRSTRHTPTELPVVLDRASETTLPVQLADALREAIDRGALRPNDPLPATRALASRLGVARGVAVTAYEQLAAEGYLLGGQGLGTVVHPQLGRVQTQAQASTRAPAPTQAQQRGRGRTRDRAVASRAGSGAPRASADPPPLAPLAVGAPDSGAVDTPPWRTAWRRAVARAHLDAPELGDQRLREEIAEHLRRMRGTQRPADDVIVTAGARDGLNLLLTALAAHRDRGLAVGVEDPGFPSLRRVAARHSAEIVPLRVDAEGLDTARLPERGLDVVIVTPSHQYPLGGSLPIARRRELLAWANATGVTVVEDDYDSELRHVGSPLPALAALDDPVNGSVALLGTFSKTVTPALSAGYLLAPARLRGLIEPVRRELGGPVSAVVQAALAEYLASGELRRHIARMRRRYASRRELVEQTLSGVPGVRVRQMSGGLHVVLELAAGKGAAAEAERRVSALAAERALGAVPLSAYWQGRGRSRGEREERFGLVIGTGGTGGAEFEEALAELRGLLLAERRLRA